MEDWFVGSPVTKVFVSSIVAVTFACQFKLVTPFQLYYNFDLVFRKHQYWRLITTFLFNGTVGIDFIFNIFFMLTSLTLVPDTVKC